MISNWTLGKKFSLFLIVIALLGSLMKIWMLSRHLNYQAEQAVKERAEILLTTMQAARDYTRDHIQPIVERQSDTSEVFIRESVPNFAARTIFDDFRQHEPEFQDFLYKEAALNPTNPKDRADEFEQQIFLTLQKQFQEQLQAQTQAQKQAQKQAQTPTKTPERLSGYRVMNGEKRFYLARPLVMRDPKCLDCHGNPSQAPRPLVEMYGSQNGFGWKLNDVVAAQMMYVPADRIFEQGRQNLLAVAQILLAILGMLFVVVNLLLWRAVIRPLKTLTRTAKQISSCSLNPLDGSPSKVKTANPALDVLTLRRDEPGQLARAFEYMLQVLNQREQDLQQAVQERTQSLELEMRDRQNAQDALQTYAHAINHDLRNMVMGISNVLQVILYRDASMNQGQGAEDSVVDSGADSVADSIEVEPKALTMIQKSCDRQLSLMNSLMEVQSSDVWRIVLQPTAMNLQQLMAELQSTCEPKLIAAQSRLQIQCPGTLPPIEADGNQVQRVFENLIGNALKYNPQGVTITIKAERYAANPQQIRCAVADDGVGIDCDNDPDLFQLYNRGQQRDQASGHGLGLYICRKIVEAHGGEIGLIPSPTGGAEIWFTLPIFLENSPRANSQSALTP